MRNIASSRILHVSETSTIAGPRKPWIWPLPRLDGVTPSILLPQDQAGREGVEIGYHSRTSSPSLVPVFAAQDGIITYAARTDQGATLCLDHASGWSTQYEGLEHALVLPTDRFCRRRKARVRAGDVLGHARRMSLRIRFALSRLTDEGWSAIDPAETMRTWSLLPWFDEATSVASRVA